MYFIFIIFHMSIIASGQNIQYSIGNQPTINTPCLIRNTGQRGTCVNINYCPSVLSALPIQPQTCSFSNTEHIVCCPILEKQLIKYVDRYFSNSKIINMCYNYYAGRSDDGSVTCNFARNCIVNSCRVHTAGYKIHAPVVSHMYTATLGWRQFNYGYDFRCGAVLIARNFVLTAAHCMLRGPPDIVRLGDKVYKPRYSQDINVAGIHIHPEYHSLHAYNDIAIIKLAQEADEQFNIACLWNDGANLAPNLIVTGYGSTEFGGHQQDLLYKFYVALMNNTICNNQFFRLQNGLLNSQLCAGDPQARIDTCQRDSGGPLFTELNIVIKPECKIEINIAHVVGITSHGVCGETSPGLYTRVSSYLNWIDSIIFGFSADSGFKTADENSIKPDRLPPLQSSVPPPENLQTMNGLSNENAQKITKKAVKRDFSKSKIINFCYNYYIDTCDQVKSAFVSSGVKVPITLHLYLVTLGWGNINNGYQFRCGASLITRNFVLTAAHCLLQGKPDIARLGAKVNKGEASQDIEVNRIYFPREYNPFQNKYYDIALVELAKEAEEQFILACIWEDDATLAPYLQAVGYGATYFGGETQDELYQVSLQLVNNTVCSVVYSDDEKVPNGIINTQLCAGDPNLKMDTCMGDSGGPLLTKIELTLQRKCNRRIDAPHILGITSFGKPCGTSVAGVYTRVSSYLDWIDSIIFGNSVL